jgi:prepilin-type N-terminal cleavage/methylation domain-containing protein
MNHAVRRTRGYTLIELVSAMGVLGIGLFAIVTSFHYGLEKVRAMQEMHTAQTVAQNRLELLRAVPFEELKEVENESMPMGPALEKLVRPKIEKTVRVHGDPVLNLREVEVRVSWTGDSGRPMQTSALTLIGNKGGAVR